MKFDTAPLRKSKVKMNSRVSGLRSERHQASTDEYMGTCAGAAGFQGLGYWEFGWCMFSQRFQSDIQREMSNGQQMPGTYNLQTV